MISVLSSGGETDEIVAVNLVVLRSCAAVHITKRRVPGGRA